MTLGVSLDTESQLNMYQELCIEQIYATCWFSAGFVLRPKTNTLLKVFIIQK